MTGSRRTPLANRGQLMGRTIAKIDAMRSGITAHRFGLDGFENACDAPRLGGFGMRRKTLGQR